MNLELDVRAAGAWAVTAVILAPFVPAAAPLRAQLPDSVAGDSLRPVPLRPLTVTVLRLPFRIDGAPFSISVVERAELRGRAGSSLREVLRGLPGVQVDDRHNEALGERISIRGFGARAQFGVRGVKVLVDGIPATLPDGQTVLGQVEPASVVRAEVIRGPASSLYGNAAGGVIQLETAAPPAAPLRPSVELAAGPDGYVRATASAAGTTGEWGYRLDVNRREGSGHRDWSSYGRWTAGALLLRDLGRGELRLRAAGVDYRARNPGALSLDQLADDRTQAHGFNRVQRTGEEGRQGQLGAGWRGGWAGGELDVTGYGLARSIENPIPPTIIDLDRRAGGVRLTYRRGGDGALGWSASAEADLQRDDRRNHVNEEGRRGDLTLDQDESVRGLAATLQLRAALGARTHLLAGGRYDRVRFRVEDRLRNGDPDDSGSRTMDAWSPSLGVSVRLPGEATLYANVATAFETPTTTELANRPDGAGGFNPGLEPQRTLSAEAGARGRLAERLAWRLAAYRAEVEDALIPFEVADAAGRQFFRNAGSAVHRGVEASLFFAPVRTLSITAAYAHTDARFEDYATADARYDGNRVPGVGPHRLDLGLTWATAGGWLASLEHRWSSETPVDDANTINSPEYHVTDLRAERRGLRLLGASAAPFVEVRNVLDREYDASVVVNAFGGRYFEPAPGRSLYLGLDLGLDAL